MVNLNKNNIRRNIFKLLDYSGLTDSSFANLLGVSDKTIKRIKKDEGDFSIDCINKACDFFQKSLTSINSKDVEVNRMFRNMLIAQHKNNPEYSTILEKQPSITYAINFELLHDDSFRTKGLGINKISDIFKARGWKFSSSYISGAMVRNAHIIKRIPDPDREGWYLYTAK